MKPKEWLKTGKTSISSIGIHTYLKWEIRDGGRVIEMERGRGEEVIKLVLGDIFAFL